MSKKKSTSSLISDLERKGRRTFLTKDETIDKTMLFVPPFTDLNDQ